MKLRSVLVMEDDKTLLSALHAALSDAGYEVHLATSLTEAACQMRHQVFSWVVMDYGLADGRATELREFYPLPAERIVVITGNAESPRLQREVEELGIQHILQKPFRLSTLVNLLGEPREADGPRPQA